MLRQSSYQSQIPNISSENTCACTRSGTSGRGSSCEFQHPCLIRALCRVFLMDLAISGFVINRSEDETIDPVEDMVESMDESRESISRRLSRCLACFLAESVTGVVQTRGGGGVNIST